MRKLALVTGVLLGTAGIGFAEEPDDQAIEIKSPVTKVLIPPGFDSNDNVEVILQEDYPNSCYKTGKSSARFIKEENTIFVRGSSYFTPNKFCLMMTIPFVQTVNVGVLPVESDNTEVFRAVLPTLNQMHTFGIKKAKAASADDFIYAPVSAVDLSESEDGVQTLKVMGTFPTVPDACWHLDSVKVDLSVPHLIVVQPVMSTKPSNGEKCQLKLDYSHKMDVPFRGDGVIHVRTLNGQAINQYVDMH